jgi:hypothetical protein
MGALLFRKPLFVEFSSVGFPSHVVGCAFHSFGFLGYWEKEFSDAAAFLFSNFDVQRAFGNNGNRVGIDLVD